MWPSLTRARPAPRAAWAPGVGQANAGHGNDVSVVAGDAQTGNESGPARCPEPAVESPHSHGRGPSLRGTAGPGRVCAGGKRLPADASDWLLVTGGITHEAPHSRPAPRLNPIAARKKRRCRAPVAARWR
ncbi:unnamed protein product [Lampetra planeri]